METPVIGRYQVKDGLGRGAMGSVYRAYDPKMDRDVAIKILHKEFARSQRHRTRFEREARTIAALHHPNIVELFDHGGSPDDHLYLVMEYIAGPHVGSLVREYGALDESVLCAIGVELAAALAHAHRAGVIHRDLKPENVFIDKGRLVLADFGIVKAITADNPLGAAAAAPKTDVIGTPGFMAPEQLKQEPLDARTDIFSFGALLYYLATLKLPYSADSPYALLKEFRETRPTPLCDVRRDLSDTVSQLVQDCVEVERDYRPPDIHAVSKRLRSALDALGARDAREILAGYEADPAGFATREGQRVVAHLLEQLKIAVRDGNGVAADTIRSRISVLDPENTEAGRITGAEQIVSRIQRDPAPEQVLTRARRSRRILGLGLVVTALAIAGWLAVDAWRAQIPPEPVPSHAETSILWVQAREQTHVFVNGRAIGATPELQPLAIASGTAEVELVASNNRRLTRTVELAPGARVTLVVDWPKLLVEERREDLPQEEVSAEGK